MTIVDSFDKEAVGAKLIEDISQLVNFSLGAGAATCQVCGSSLSEGDAVAVCVFRPAGAPVFQLGYVMCGGGQHDHPEEFTLGVRELLVSGRVGWCSDVVTQSAWPVLLAPDVLGVSPAATQSLTELPVQDTDAGDATVSGEPNGPVPLVEQVLTGRAERCGTRPDGERHDVFRGGERQ